MAFAGMLLLAGCMDPASRQEAERKRTAEEPKRTAGGLVVATGAMPVAGDPRLAKPSTTQDKTPAVFKFNLPHLLYPIGDWRDSTNSWAFAVEIEDVTRDGKKDVILVTREYGTSPYNNTVMIYAQNPGGTLEPPDAYSYLAGPSGPVTVHRVDLDVEVADLDSDGHADIMVGYNQHVMVMLSRPDGFDIASYPVASRFLGGGEYVTHLLLRDLDMDGDIDALAFNKVGGASVLYNDASGRFASAEAILDSFSNLTDVKTADFDGDGKEEIVALRGARVNQTLWIVDVDGAPAEMPYTEIAIPDAWTSDFTLGGLAVGDWTGDGRIDVAVSIQMNLPLAAVLVFAQDANGILQAPRSMPTWQVPSGMLNVDLNGDDRIDLLVDHPGWDMGYYLAGQQGLEAEIIINHGTLGGNGLGSKLMAVGDITDDGCMDIARAESSVGLMVYTSSHCVRRVTGGNLPARRRPSP